MGGRIAAAAGTTGLGLTLMPCFYAHGGCGGRPPAEGQRRFISSLASFDRLLAGAERHVTSSGLADARLGLALHSLRAVAPVELAKLADEARQRERPIHIHAAEQQKEVEECLAWSGKRPVEWLLENATIDARWCLVHATHMTEAETAGLARSGAIAGLCPITESNLGDGIFPATRFMAAGGRLGVGSDSNVRISLASELRTLEYSQRLRDMRRNCLAPEGRSSGRTLLDAAARGGAQAIGRQAGALRAGLLADIVVLDTGHPALAGRSDDTALDTWLFAGGNELVGEVWSGGRHVVIGSRHIARDRLAAPFITVMRKLAATL
jgi:formiminoglutamate deiminase